MPPLILFCLPFAGGNRYSYRFLEKLMPPAIKLVPLEYPGRGGRSAEPLVWDVEILVRDLFNRIADTARVQRYAIYGHSLGALIGFLIARELATRRLPLPVRLFLSGSHGPSVEKEKIGRYAMSKSDFLAEMRRLNGCPADILENEELFEYLEPILRSDFRASESYAYLPAPPLDTTLMIITGDEEKIEGDDLWSWQKESTRDVSYHKLPGDHFFIFNYGREVVHLMTESLAGIGKTQAI